MWESHVGSPILLREDLLPFLVLLPSASYRRGKQMLPLLPCQPVELTPHVSESRCSPRHTSVEKRLLAPQHFYAGALTFVFSEPGWNSLASEGFPEERLCKSTQVPCPGQLHSECSQGLTHPWNSHFSHVGQTGVKKLQTTIWNQPSLLC